MFMTRQTFYHDGNIEFKLDKVQREVELLNKMLEETGKKHKYNLVKVETA